MVEIVSLNLLPGRSDRGQKPLEFCPARASDGLGSHGCRPELEQIHTLRKVPRGRTDAKLFRP